MLGDDVGLAFGERRQRRRAVLIKDSGRVAGDCSAVHINLRAKLNAGCLIVRIVPLHHDNVWVPDIYQLRDVLAVRIKVVEATLIEFFGDAAEIYICPCQRRVSRSGQPLAVRYDPKIRVVTIRADLVPGRREIGHAGRGYVVNAKSDDARLEEWLIKIKNVIADNLGGKTFLRRRWIGE